MQKIKQLLSDLTKSPNRINFIIDYLVKQNIEHFINNYTFGKNIIVEKNNIFSQKKLIIMAHHDVLNPDFENANDNSSSVAVLLKVAEYFKSYNLKCSLKIVFNDNEELLGGLLIKDSPISYLENILEKSGSFVELKKEKESSNKKIDVLILELSGIGEGVFIAESSGLIQCNSNLNKKLVDIAEKYNFKYSLIPVPMSDYISVHTLKLSGTVIGAIPYFEIEEYRKKKSNNFYSSSWRRNHTSFDIVDAISEKSLNMIYTFLIKFIEEYS